MPCEPPSTLETGPASIQAQWRRGVAPLTSRGRDRFHARKRPGFRDPGLLSIERVHTRATGLWLSNAGRTTCSATRGGGGRHRRGATGPLLARPALHWRGLAYIGLHGLADLGRAFADAGARPLRHGFHSICHVLRGMTSRLGDRIGREALPAGFLLDLLGRPGHDLLGAVVTFAGRLGRGIL